MTRTEIIRHHAAEFAHAISYCYWRTARYHAREVIVRALHLD